MTPGSSEAKADPRELGAVERSRLEFLVDGIFAIAMTILVLDLPVPELKSGTDVTSLARALSSSRAAFGSYLLSFFVLGVMWYRQNRAYRHVQRVTTPGYVLYLIQLAAAAAFPFCAALLGRHLGNPLAVAIYAGCVAVYNWASFASLSLAVRDGGVGWIYYPKRHGGGGAASTAFLDVQKYFEPSKQHVLDRMRSAADEDQGAGGPPTPQEPASDGRSASADEGAAG